MPASKQFFQESVKEPELVTTLRTEVKGEARTIDVYVDPVVLDLIVGRDIVPEELQRSQEEAVDFITKAAENMLAQGRRNGTAPDDLEAMMLTTRIDPGTPVMVMGSLDVDALQEIADYPVLDLTARNTDPLYSKREQRFFQQLQAVPAAARGIIIHAYCCRRIFGPIYYCEPCTIVILCW